MIDILLLDIDDTILDFKRAERAALTNALKEQGILANDYILDTYSEINKTYWQRLERKEITREDVLVQRYHSLFQTLGLQGNPNLCAERYEYLLAFEAHYLTGAKEALDILKKSCRLFAVSNGTCSVQDRRLTDAELYPYFEGVFISEEVGADKPSNVFFDYVFSRISEFDKSRTLIVGDSLTSDILGGRLSGIQTCWINPGNKPSNENVDYEIKSLRELPDLLNRLNG